MKEINIMSPKTNRPRSLTGYCLEQQTHCGKIYVTVNYDPETNQIIEVFIRFGKAGGCGSAMGDGIAKLISYGLRSGMDAKDAVKALEGQGCHHGANTCLHNIAMAIRYVETALESGVDINTAIELVDAEKRS